MFYEGIIYEDNLFNLQCIISAERVSHRNKQFFERRIRDNSTVTQIKDFRHLYGYLMCYLQMTKLLIEYMWNSTASSEISVELNLISKGIKRYYNGLSREQLKNINSLNSVELSFLKNILEIEKNNYQMIPTTNASLDLQLKKAQQEIRDIHNSYTYKIGRFITFIPRIIRKSLKCYKENGFKYTLYKVSEHLFK